ncbi:hypothetical protein FQR65_LT14422 [Abscondita terminalis]|nr:hypothetical protein FQR65_LT14422 [Abscondita terminalis]
METFDDRLQRKVGTLLEGHAKRMKEEVEAALVAIEEVKKGRPLMYPTNDVQSLTPRRKFFLKTTRSLMVGELVMVRSDLRKRLDWPLGRVIEVLPGKNKVCRTGKMKTQDGTFTRPVQDYIL